MYCKHCGNQIADDSVFCAKCGKLVVEATLSLTETSAVTKSDEIRWWTTENMQWEKPTAARCVQIAIIVILGLLSLYPLWCFISGGDAREYYYGGMNGMERRHEVYVNDPWKLKVLEFTSVEMFNWHHEDAIVKYGYFTEEDAKNVFRWRMFLVLLPFVALIWLTARWMKKTRFPGEKDIVPRDVADEIEQYNWDGFTKYKYVFYKKDGKYGIIDARYYCVYAKAKYDSIAWRLPNKLYDASIGGDTKTFKIVKTAIYNPNKKEIDSTNRIVGIILGLWGLFWAVVPIISLLLPDDDSEIGGLIFAFVMGVASLIGSYSILKEKTEK
ncbi:MAG: zinc ribbon domain-containing protein [Bacteroidales bacterium]|nr:zinc ribbon domain-containing protein [Bacteroidales bacterium]